MHKNHLLSKTLVAIMVSGSTLSAIAMPAYAETIIKAPDGKYIAVNQEAQRAKATSGQKYPKVQIQYGSGYQTTFTIVYVNPYQINPQNANYLYLDTSNPRIKIKGVFPKTDDDGDTVIPTEESINLINQTLQEEHTNYQALPLSQQDSGTTTLS